MSNEILFQQAAKELAGVLNTKQTRRDYEPALAGDSGGVVDVPGRTAFIFARLQGDASRLVSAYNPRLVLAADTPIILLKKFDRDRVVGYVVDGISTAALWANWQPVTYPPHHLSHEPVAGGGWDLVNIYPAAMTMLRCDAQAAPDLTLSIAPGMYTINGVLCYYAGGTSPAFTPPGSGSEYQVLSINAGGVLTITANGLTYPPFSMSIPSDNIPIAAPYLTAGQTAITASDLLFDPRPFLGLGGSGTTDPLALLDSDGTTLLDSDGNMLDANT